MKNLAIMDSNNIVVNIIIANDDFYVDGAIEYTSSNPAHIGGDYFEGMFYPPKPYPSWVRVNGDWEAPIPCPHDCAGCGWDEENQRWIDT